MKIKKSKIKKIEKKIIEELSKDPFFCFCSKQNPKKYEEEFNLRLAKEIKLLKETFAGKKQSKKILKLALIEDEFSHINDPWHRKFYANKKNNKLKNKKL